MFSSILRVLLGFLAACLVAGFIQVSFAIGLQPIFQGSDEQSARALEWTLLTATHCAVFAAPFALVAAAIGEWLSLRSLIYYTVSGLAIAMAGFAAQYQGEAAGQASILNNYAFLAYLTTGAAAGPVYWLLAGRSAGEISVPEPQGFSGKTEASGTGT